MKSLNINAANAFNALVNWFHDKVIIRLGAPGVLVGLSGTDSIVSFLAASKAFTKAGSPARVWGVHFAPSDEFLCDYPEAKAHLWFSKEIIPWLREQAKWAPITVDTSIDWRCDGLRWGALADMSAVCSDYRGRTMRLPEDQSWVVGTRNRTEDMLFNYSNASTLVSLQPIIHLWKSEILQIAEFLNVPQLVINKSCETDCICGRDALAANYIQEVDALLRVRGKEHMTEFTIPNKLHQQLNKYIDAQIAKNSFKARIPYTPDQLVFEFESGLVDVKKFNHFGHLYIAFCYLKNYTFEIALERYLNYLKPILESSGNAHRFNPGLTKAYFTHLQGIMKEYPAYDNFYNLAECIPRVLDKIKA